MQGSDFEISLSALRRRAERAAADFGRADFVHAVARDALFERLEPMLIEAATVVDLGAACGGASRQLVKRFRGAHILSVDLSPAMLTQARRKRSWFAKSSAVVADARALPFADQSVDVVFSNLLLPWCNDPAAVFAEVSRILQSGGLFLFSTLGPDSLRPVAEAWAETDDGPHLNRFLDMHLIGDAAVRAGLRDPVLDVDRLTLSYSSIDKLFRDLSNAGARNSLEKRRNTLTGKQRFAAMRAALERRRVDGRLSLDLELVYGHCWGPGARLPPGEVRIQPGQIGRRTG